MEDQLTTRHSGIATAPTPMSLPPGQPARGLKSKCKKYIQKIFLRNVNTIKSMLIENIFRCATTDAKRSLNFHKFNVENVIETRAIK